MIIESPDGRISTIPESEGIFDVVPTSYEQAKGLMQGRALVAYMIFGCGCCQSKMNKIVMRGKDRLLASASERGVAMVYVDKHARQFATTLVPEQRADEAASLFVLYDQGREVSRELGFPFADKLAELIEANFPTV